ncbi:MAG: PLP-dependent aminotransferase family protein [Candidatus Sericytochromatia bacterium]
MNINNIENNQKLKDFEYIKLAHIIQEGINNGEYGYGSKLPSIRTLRRNHNLSISTVLKAFYELEKRGLIVAKEKYGYYVNSFTKKDLLIEPTKKCKLKAEPVNKSNMINSIINSHNKNTIFPLSSSLLSKKLVPHKKIELSLKKAIIQNDIDINRYSFPPGLEDLRKQISLKYKELGIYLTSNDIVITNGCMDAVTLSLKMVAQKGDIIAIESPTYYGFLQLIESMGMYAIEIPSNPITGIEIDKFETIINKNNIKACIFVSNFNNPMGFSVPDNNKRKIVEIITDKNIPLIESDVYSDLYFGELRPKPYKYFDKSNLVFNCSSLSKTLSAGLRIGWVINSVYSEKIQKQQFINQIAVPTLTQVAASIYLKDGSHERHLRIVRKILKNQLLEIKSMISKHFPESTKISNPDGGFLLMLELDENIDSLNLYQICLEEGISIIPCVLQSTSNRFKNYIRLSYSYEDREEYERNLIKLTNIIKTMKK